MQRACKVIKNNFLLKHYETKQPSKILLSSFCVGHSTAEHGACLLEWFVSPVRLPFKKKKKANFSFTRNSQLKTVSGLGMGAYVLSALGLPWHRPTETVCMQPLSVSSYVCALYCVQKVLFPCLASSLVLTLFPPPLMEGFVSPKVRDLVKTSHLGLRIPRSLIIHIAP